ncbi:MAG: low affinity iron permease family protein [Brevundimonas sp.]
MEKLFIRFASATARIAGRPLTFALCLFVVLVWAVTGPIFGFSQTWQLVINTGTTIVTFLMVFLIQNTQNRDAAAMQAKLDELVYASKDARNRFIGIEHLTDAELGEILREVEERAIEVHKARSRRRSFETAQE